MFFYVKDESIGHLFISCPFAKLVLCIVHMTCSVVGCVGLIKQIKFKSVWELVLYIGRLGMLIMILFLTDRKLLLCKLSRWLAT